ncbi:Y4yA family PLP-dependent enzyme [Rhodopirellula bahusiensis]|nr:Y4yA family PLP-dependent enzyme [Rhodopirellula bahusiensis]
MNRSILPNRAESPAPASSDDHASDLRSRCRGVVPLDAIWMPWMTDLASNPVRVEQLIQLHGSPVNVLTSNPMRATICDLKTVAAEANLPLQIHLARKANKCVEFVRAGIPNSIGFDVASESELRQTLGEFEGSLDEPFEDSILCTAAIKPDGLIRLCVTENVTLVIDNADELATLREVLACIEQPAPVARIAFRLQPCRQKFPALATRFGTPASELVRLAKTVLDDQRIEVVGVHFHVQRSHEQFAPQFTRSLIEDALETVDRLRETGHSIAWLDMGGGFPINYLRDESQWRRFLALAQPDPASNGEFAIDREMTWSQRPLIDVDPAWQPWNAVHWFREVLTPTLVSEITRRELTLKCEPGRALLDGCGMTIAEVQFVKNGSDDELLVGLMMNSSQCRTTRDDFLVDPIVIGKSNSPDPAANDNNDDETTGFFVGGYCTESEVLMQRRFRFPHGISRGDLVLIPNTAAYQMHFAESQAHQMPLAANVFF